MCSRCTALCAGLSARGQGDSTLHVTSYHNTAAYVCGTPGSRCRHRQCLLQLQLCLLAMTACFYVGVTMRAAALQAEAVANGLHHLLLNCVADTHALLALKAFPPSQPAPVPAGRFVHTDCQQARTKAIAGTKHVKRKHVAESASTGADCRLQPPSERPKAPNSCISLPSTPDQNASVSLQPSVAVSCGCGINLLVLYQHSQTSQLSCTIPAACNSFTVISEQRSCPLPLAWYGLPACLLTLALLLPHACLYINAYLCRS